MVECDWALGSPVITYFDFSLVFSEASDVLCPKEELIGYNCLRKYTGLIGAPSTYNRLAN